jgi:hypothetical protein
LDSKLSGDQHSDYLVDRCERTLNLLRCLAGVWWGAHPYSLKLIYNALIRSVLDYGAFLLEPCNQSALKKLDGIQSKALRIVVGAMKSSPLNALRVECVDPPFHLRRQYLGDRYFYRALQFSNHPLIPKLFILSDQLNTRYWQHKKTPCLVISWQRFQSILAPTFMSPRLPLFNSNFNALIFPLDVHDYIGINKETSNAQQEFNYAVDTNWQGIL